MRDKVERWVSKNCFLSKIVAFVEYIMLPFSKEAKEKISEALNKYVKPESLANKQYVRKLKRDILFSRLYYDILPIQYFLFGFERLNDNGRREFVGEREKVLFTDDLHRTSDLYLSFRNKKNAYDIFREYYKREVISIEQEGKEAFLDFADRNSKFIIKLVDSALGKDIEIYDADNSEESLGDLFDRLSSSGSFIAEEFITQADEMKNLYPYSVNTVRFATCLKNDSIMHMFSFLRMGSGGEIIDNATTGGISAAIDIETGLVTTLGYKEDLSTYLKHPDTGTQIIGMQIPKWDELLKLVDELVYVIPEQKYVGWDLALTNEGWVMVEGNDSAMMTAIQMCQQRGIRKVFDQAFKEG